MENYRTVILLSILAILGGVFLVPTINAYSPDTTHRALASEMVTFFNLNFPSERLTDLEKRVVMQGSEDEDSIGRQAYHFYDPVYKKGVKTFFINWASSKQWAQDHKLQSKRDIKMLAAGAFLKPFSANSDYSWERSVYEYAWGDKMRGLKGLGQILHLIQDTSVPDHTRDDPHPPFVGAGSPYEEWTSQFNSSNIDVLSKIRYERPILFTSLNEHFDSLAEYSNSNFFSKDTIFESRYKDPIVNFEERETLSDGNQYLFGYTNLLNNTSIRLIQIKRGRDWQKPEYSISDPDNLILSDYWLLLSKRAVLHGAGVIKLFLAEVEREKRTKKLLSYNMGPADKIIASASSLFSSTKRLQQEGILDENLDFIDDIEVDFDLGFEPEPPIVVTKSFSETLPPIVAVTKPPIISLDSEETDNKIEDKKKIEVYSGGIGGGIPRTGGSSPTPEPESDLDPIDTPISPIIISPSDFSSIFTNNSITFSGTSTPSAIISSDFSTSTTTVDVFGEWSLILDLSQGTTTINFYSQNGAGTSPPTAETISIDSLGPNLSNFVISECNDSIANNGCLLATTTLNLSWEASNDASNYTIECSTCGSGFPTSPSATSTSVNISNQTVHTLTLKSQDDLGNETSLLSQQIEINLRPVIINEVAWMGTTAESSDEWIELFNTSSFDITLGTSTATTTWSLVAEDGSPNVELEGIILAKNFFLLERTASTSTSILEDQIYTGALENSGETLSLYNPNNIEIDEVEIDASTLTWPAGSNTTDQTMERIGPYGGGNIYNWRTASTTASSSVAFDIDNNVILGTPKAQNSVYNENWNPTFVSDSTVIDTNTTWSNNSSPYIIESNSNQFTTIESGATLTIEEGAVLMSLSFYYSAMRVEGTLNVEGSSSNEVIFTFYDDAEYGGETMGDPIASALKGKWKGIEFSEGSNSTLNYMRFRYAGADAPPKVALEIEPGASISFNNSIFEHNGGIVFDMDADDITLANNYSDVSIQNSSFINNGIPAMADYAAILLNEVTTPIISGNTFTDNAYPPVKIISSYPNISDNTATGNFYNGIYVDDATTLATDTTWGSTLPYILEVNNNRRVTVASSTTLTINPGVVIKTIGGSQETFRIEGDLIWNGTVGNEGVFTSFYDDSYGGDTNNDGATTTTASVGDWKDFHFMSGSSGTLSNLKFLYGAGGSSTTTPGILIDSGASVVMDGVVFE